MMEFTLSRASLMICGVLLLTAACSPIAGLMQSENDGELQALAEKDARLFDALMESDYDVVIIHGDSFLPSPEYGLKVDGYLLTLYSPDGKEYAAAMRNCLRTMEFGYGFESEYAKNDLMGE